MYKSSNLMQIFFIGQDALFPKRCCSANKLLANSYFSRWVFCIDTIVSFLEHNMSVLQEVFAYNK